jgi:hypothetical protein
MAGYKNPDIPHDSSAPKGIEPFDLLAPYCEECGRPKINRLLFDGLAVQGCATCTEAVTRHRCTKLPDILSLAAGESWECPDCGSVWTHLERLEDCPDCCGHCGHMVMRDSWHKVLGDRIDTAPRYEPQVYTPLRNKLKGGTVSRDKLFPGLPY